MSVTFRRQNTYNAAGQVLTESTNNAAGSSTTTYNYGTNGSSYAGGAVVSQSGTNTPLYGSATSFTITNSFIWRGSALQGTVSNAQSGTATTSTFTYNANNYLTQVNTTGAQAKSISYTTDSVGQIMVRTQTTNGSTTSPKDFSFYFSGAKIGAIGNNGTANVDYTQAIKDDGTVDGTGPFREGQTLGNSYADFDQNWTAVGPAAGVEGANSSYTVQAGQTLSGIASAVWGDASLWYLIAQANGLISDDAVTAGQVLVVPAKVTGSHNNAATYKPYNAAQAIGDVAPGAPKPKSNNCGVLGAVLMAAVAIAVSYFLTPVAAKFFTTGFLGGLGPVAGGFVAGAVTAATASVASQIVGLGLGLQDKINWKGVGLAAISGGIGGGMSGLRGLKLGGFVGKVAGGADLASKVARGVFANLAGQGLGALTKLQKEFSWSSVAASAVGAATNHYAGKLGIGPVGTSGALLLAQSTARSVIDGDSFGDVLLAELPSVLGQLVFDQVKAVVTGGSPTDHVAERLRKDAASGKLSAERIAQMQNRFANSASSNFFIDPGNPNRIYANGEWLDSSARAPTVGELIQGQSLRSNASWSLGPDFAVKLEIARRDSEPRPGDIVVTADRRQRSKSDAQLEAARLADDRRLGNQNYVGRPDRSSPVRSAQAAPSTAGRGPSTYKTELSYSSRGREFSDNLLGLDAEGYIEYGGSWFRDLNGKTYGASGGLANNVDDTVETVWKGIPKGANGWEVISRLRNIGSSGQPLPEGYDQVVEGVIAKQMQWDEDNPFMAAFYASGRISYYGFSELGNPIYRGGGNLTIGLYNDVTGSNIGDFSTTNIIYPVIDASLYLGKARIGLVNAPSDAMGLGSRLFDAGANYGSSFSADYSNYGLRGVLSLRTDDIGTASGFVGSLAVGGEFTLGGKFSRLSRVGTGAAVNPMRAGQLAEVEQLTALGSGGKVSFTPSPTQIDSAAFKAIVGDAKYTAKGDPVGTIYDATLGNGVGEIKNGSSVLDSSYQLRLQTYGALANKTPFTIYTSRPANPTFDAWLTRWGVSVQPLPK